MAERQADPTTGGNDEGATAASTVATSADGTAIGYRSSGHGPGLIVLHGAMESSADYVDLTVALAGSFTVHVLDRRGRGLSGPHGDAFGLQTEVDDVRAVLEATGAQHLYGVSSGGVVALQVALDLPGVRQVAVYEPALSVPGHESDDYVGRYEEAIGFSRDTCKSGNRPRVTPPTYSSWRALAAGRR